VCSPDTIYRSVPDTRFSRGVADTAIEWTQQFGTHEPHPKRRACHCHNHEICQKEKEPFFMTTINPCYGTERVLKMLKQP
jgi:hypothetical protein